MATPEERAQRAERIVMAATPMPGGPAARLRVSWGGVWAGLLLGLGLTLLLGALGLAIGITAADVGPGSEGAGARGLGIGAGIWALVTLVVSLFVAGMVAARSGGVIDRATAAIHGALVWVLATLATIYLTATGIGLGASLVAGVAGGAARAAGGAAQQMAAGGGVMADLTSGDIDRILARIDDPETAGTLASITGLPPPEVRRMLGDARARIQANRGDPARALDEAKSALQPMIDVSQQRAAQAAERAQPYATGASWASFAGLLVSLAAALAGAMAGCRQAREETVTPGLP